MHPRIKLLAYILLPLLLLLGLARLALELPLAQNWLFGRMAASLMESAAQPLPQEDALQAYVCGRASPLPAPGTAQACIAIMTPDHLYLVDAGAGALAQLQQGRLPLARLQGVFVTHFHSDHIAEIPEVNLNSWVAGRPQPLKIYGPDGVRRLVSGLNDAYALDNSHRVAHHGEALLPPALGKLAALEVTPGEVIQDGNLKVTVYRADHGPVKPAVGYRFDYLGRSIYVSGDSLITEATMAATDNLDLLLHDALSEEIISALSQAAYAAGQELDNPVLKRNGKILEDVINYHAGTEAIAELLENTDVGMVGLYHLVPVPLNLVMERIFMRHLPSEVLLVEEGQWFVLPTTDTGIIVR